MRGWAQAVLGIPLRRTTPGQERTESIKGPAPQLRIGHKRPYYGDGRFPTLSHWMDGPLAKERALEGILVKLEAMFGLTAGICTGHPLCHELGQSAPLRETELTGIIGTFRPAAVQNCFCSTPQIPRQLAHVGLGRQTGHWFKGTVEFGMIAIMENCGIDKSRACTSIAQRPRSARD